MIGDRRHYVVALLTLDPARARWPRRRRPAAPRARPRRRRAARSSRPTSTSRSRRVNERLARYETIKRVAVLPRELTVEAGELTPTLKLKRRVIHELHKAAIEALYA